MCYFLLCKRKVKFALQFELEQQLCLLGRDEVTAWLSMRGRPWNVDPMFRKYVASNIEGVVTRAETMACKSERESVRAFFHSLLLTYLFAGSPDQFE